MARCRPRMLCPNQLRFFPSTVFLALLPALAALFGGSQHLPQPRWGQASLLLSEDYLLIYGGKVPGSGGYTYDSAPSTNELWVLSLNSTFPTSAPPWQLASPLHSNDVAQAVSFASLGTLSKATSSQAGLLLAFGGDAMSSPNLTSADSAQVITLSALDSLGLASTAVNITKLDSATQPIRRTRHTFSTATNASSLRAWIMGGQKADGSQKVYDEAWQYSAPKSNPLRGVWSACPAIPTPVFDHVAIPVADGSNPLAIYVIGGSSTDQKNLDTSNMYRFTPDLNSADSCNGSWTSIRVQGNSKPLPRRGHSVVSVSSTQVLLFGGASADGQTVYDDLWLLDLGKASWQVITPTRKLSPRWGHSMVRIGRRVVIAFGYGPISNSQPASSSVGIFNLETMEWTDEYVPAVERKKENMPTPAVGTPSSDSPVEGSNGGSWQVVDSSPPIKPVSPPSSEAESTGDGSSHIGVILGIALGVVGLIALMAGAVVVYKRKQKYNQQRRREAAAYRRRADGSGEGFEQDDDQAGLVGQQDSLHGSSRLGHGPGPRSLTPKAMAGVAIGVGAFWSRRGGGRRRERFDILADEESEEWEVEEHDQEAYDVIGGLKKYADGWTDRVRVPHGPVEMTEARPGAPAQRSTRGGQGIWQAMDPCAGSASGSVTSFLGASLAPWSDASDASATRIHPFAEPETLSADHIDGEEQSIGIGEEHSEHGHTTSSHSPLARLAHHPALAVDGPGPAPAALDVGGPSSVASLISGRPCVGPRPLHRCGTWWDRLRHGPQRNSPSDLAPGALTPIRDPASPPSIPGNIPQASFSHGPREAMPTTTQPSLPIDEHGRCLDVKQPLPHDAGWAPESAPAPDSAATHSSAHSGSTATSSTIEAATAQMTVVQRMWTVDSSPMTDCSSVSRLPSVTCVSRCNSLRGHIGHALREATDATDSSSSALRLEPAPARRLMGPRTTSEGLLTTLSSSANTVSESNDSNPMPRPTLQQTAGSIGVRAIVRKFEGTVESTAGSKAKSPAHKRKVKVEHNLVKKPLLYVANPDS